MHSYFVNKSAQREGYCCIKYTIKFEINISLDIMFRWVEKPDSMSRWTMDMLKETVVNNLMT